MDFVLALAPAGLMALAAIVARLGPASVARAWRWFNGLNLAALGCAAVGLAWQLSVHFGGAADPAPAGPWLAAGLFAGWVSLLVQFLGAAIGLYSARHLRGEPRQRVYIAALAAVLAAVHMLLLANHWLVLIAAWAAIGQAMHALLCFYPDRPFAVLAAHKKKIADRAADGLLLLAAGLAWSAAGSGTLTDLWLHIATAPAAPALAGSGVCLALAVIARTALMPVHGWLVQVMEAPTPVSALLHAGVVNLGGYVLVLFAPLLGVSPAACWLLVGFGLVSAVVAGLVLLTRVSQKVHLAWSTIAQMGFMLLECGLGLYLFAALHLLGHSLYKAHHFLNASSRVRASSCQQMLGAVSHSGRSMLWAVPASLAVVFGLQAAWGDPVWPWWWCALLALAWAPLLWVPAAGRPGGFAWRALGMVVFLTLAALCVDRAPLGVGNDPLDAAGIVALAGMALLYAGMGLFLCRPRLVIGVRRWVYAGFYTDEGYTWWVLRLWPVAWAGAAPPAAAARPVRNPVHSQPGY
ncbi:NADH-quinone oxidoreductase subunit L [Castellaniella hirudinis]|uniref:NADH-quinone oxidoreductase subunit L n=1 Tax=Castellaniella hirudinis TaxID=1144617 RepID=UPI0039C4997B